MNHITLDDLNRMDACEGAKEAFAERFPNGASRRELLLALVEHERGLSWFEWLTILTTEFEDLAATFAVAKKSNQQAFLTSLEPAKVARRVAIKRSSSQLECALAGEAYFIHYEQAQTVFRKAQREAIHAIAESLPEVEVTV